MLGSNCAIIAHNQRNLMVTIGVAQYPRDAKDARGLLQAADAALATAKESGRNQVALPPNEEMVMKSCYYPASSMRRLRALAERLGRKDSPLLREALDDLFRKYDVPQSLLEDFHFQRFPCGSMVLYRSCVFFFARIGEKEPHFA